MLSRTYAYMHDRALQGFLTFCYHKCHTPQHDLSFHLMLFFRFPICFTTLPFYPKNNTSFSIKQHVVFSKTSRRFQQNKPSFSVKQHVVFGKSVKKYYKTKVTNTITRSYPNSVTLVTAKNTKSLWCARVRVRERNKYYIH